MNTSEISQKLKYADFLLQSDEYAKAAAKHLFEAANMVVTNYYGLNKTAVSPQLIARKLEDGKQVEKEFARTFVSLWTASPSKQMLKDALRSIKRFMQYVGQENVNKAEKEINEEANRMDFVGV